MGFFLLFLLVLPGSRQLVSSPSYDRSKSEQKEILPKKGTLEADNSHIFYGLKKIRRESRFSLEKFAVLLGVPKETVVHWGNRNIKNLVWHILECVLE